MSASPVDARVVRLLDASLNRASEGARVAEDYCRFVLGDGHLARLAKELRHGIAAAGAAVPASDRAACRDTRGDVGTTISTPSEGRRDDAPAVCLANLHRLEEALRSLEEYGKTIEPALGARFERLRYGAYTLAKAIGVAERATARLAGACVYALVDGGDSPAAFAERLEALGDAGVDVAQLRDKRLADRELVEHARLLATICRRYGVISIVNDRADVAVAAGADGVHVGQEELSVADARAVVGPRRLVGVSTHSLDQARTAVLAGADYLGVGPTFLSGTKAFDTFPGLDLVRAVAAEIALPAFAIGGITPANAGEVAAAGLGRVAVSGALAVGNPSATVQSLRAALQGAVGQAETRR